MKIHSVFLALGLTLASTNTVAAESGADKYMPEAQGDVACSDALATSTVAIMGGTGKQGLGAAIELIRLFHERGNFSEQALELRLQTREPNSERARAAKKQLESQIGTKADACVTIQWVKSDPYDEPENLNHLFHNVDAVFAQTFGKVYAGDVKDGSNGEHPESKAARNIAQAVLRENARNRYSDAEGQHPSHHGVQMLIFSGGAKTKESALNAKWNAELRLFAEFKQELDHAPSTVIAIHTSIFMEDMLFKDGKPLLQKVTDPKSKYTHTVTGHLMLDARVPMVGAGDAGAAVGRLIMDKLVPPPPKVVADDDWDDDDRSRLTALTLFKQRATEMSTDDKHFFAIFDLVGAFAPPMEFVIELEEALNRRARKARAFKLDYVFDDPKKFLQSEETAPIHTLYQWYREGADVPLARAHTFVGQTMDVFHSGPVRHLVAWTNEKGLEVFDELVG
eukprot:Clim_evm5s240 gene=Clim_evmTU5s240